MNEAAVFLRQEPEADAVSAVRITGLGKCYQIYNSPQDRLKQSVVPRVMRLMGRTAPTYFREFWALRDVSFEVPRGHAVGIVGRNGAGKSTLLQIVAGTLAPTLGNAEVNGRVAALLELGSGFSPEFTGRENVFLNASLLGLSRDETRDRFDEIAAFADIGDFIDQPLKSYSTGMVMRVAFAVQTAVEPDVLIVDEALAVGDVRFQKKCFARLQRLRERGTTILFVTHDTGTVVQFCNSALILENGRLYSQGEPQRIARDYHRLLFEHETPRETETPEASSDLENPSPVRQPHLVEPPPRGATAKESGSEPCESNREVRYGSRKVEIVNIGLCDQSGAEIRVVDVHQEVVFHFTARYHELVPEGVAYGFIVSSAKGVDLYGTKSGLFGLLLPPGAPGCECECHLQAKIPLVPGRYFLTVAVARDEDQGSGNFLDCRFDALEFQVIGDVKCFTSGVVDFNGRLWHTVHALESRHVRPSAISQAR